MSNVGYSDALKALDERRGERRGETVQEIQSRNGKYFANPAVQLCDNDFHVAELSTLNSVRRRLASSQTQQIGSASDQQTAEVIVKQLHRIKRMGLCRYVGLSAEPLTGPLRLKDNWKWMDWVIVGGESTQGGECRVMDLAWAESLVDDCKRLRVSCFVKQLGSKPGVMKKSGAWCPREIEDPKGGSPAEWPRKLRVRRYPTGEREI
ncbi:MAG: phage Gp37/Gp68 family protein [Pirellulales bacterium]|nr:phage Gp37/Gp68 family protein [Pirellulales bacterium]